MTAPLRDVLVKRPARRSGRLRRSRPRLPATRSTSTVARREHDAFVETLDGARRRASTSSTTETDDPDLVYTFDPLLVDRRRRDPAPARQAEPGRGAGRPRGLDAGGRDPDARAGSRRRARSRAATRSGCGRTCCASGGRCGPTTRARASSPALVGGDVRIFDVPYWRGPAELIHLLSVISPVADDLAVVYLPLLPVGLWELLGELGIRLIEVPDGGVRDARLQRPGGPARRRRSWPRATRGTRRGPGRGRLRGPHLPGDRDRDQRLRRADLPDPADPARLTERRRTRRPIASTRRRCVADLEALVRIPSITGSEEAVAAWAADRLRGARADGRGRCTRTRRRSAPTRRGPARRCRGRRCRSSSAAPGRAWRPADRPVGSPRRRAARRPGDLDGRPVGRARSATGRLYGRGACDMKGGVASILAAVRALGDGRRPRAASTASWSSRSSRPRRTAARGRSPRSGPA